jgi:hypothetical protein
VALATFSTQLEVTVALDTNTTREGLVQSVGALPFLNGGTRTGHAMQKVARTVLLESAGRRAALPAYVVILTDGDTSEAANVFAAKAEVLHALPRVHVLAVGVGSAVSAPGLASIARAPEAAIAVATFAALDSPVLLRAVLQAGPCSNSSDPGESAATPAPALGWTAECRIVREQAPLALLLDSSSSLTADEWQGLLAFAAEVVQNLALVDASPR